MPKHTIRNSGNKQNKSKQIKRDQSVQPVKSTSSRNLVVCDCDRCNGKEVDPRTRKNMPNLIKNLISVPLDQTGLLKSMKRTKSKKFRMKKHQHHLRLVHLMIIKGKIRNQRNQDSESDMIGFIIWILLK
jgi:hypothetical protein